MLYHFKYKCHRDLVCNEKRLHFCRFRFAFTCYSVGVALMEILNDSLKQYTLPEGLALVLLRIYILGTKKAYWEGEGLLL